MKKAWNNISSSGRLSEEIGIAPTHCYVKFKPVNEEEREILTDDTTLVLYDYPLDYEIAEEGHYYRDPNVPITQPTPQYGAVTVDYVFPQGVDYEILEELFIPDDFSEDHSSARVGSYELIDALVDEALQITDNWEEVVENDTDNPTARSNARRSWRPSGNITVWDDVGVSITRSVRTGYETIDRTDYTPCYTSGDSRPCPYYYTETTPIYEDRTTLEAQVPVEGVEVRARRWFTTHKGFTNQYGHFTADGTFQRPANYSIDWERYHFALRDAWLSSARYNGPKKAGDWNLYLNSGEQRYYATIFKAAYHYYYKPIKGLRRPLLNGTFRTQLKLKAKLELDRSTHKWVRGLFSLGSAIKIKKYGRTSDKVYATTIHEIAHASHWNMDSYSYNRMNDCSETILGQYCSGDPVVRESWANGVEWELTRIVYLNYLGGTTIRPKYTQVVVDMIDGPTDSNNGSLDNVTGYTIRQIEDALDGQRTWDGWRDNIKSRYNNGTRDNLDALFDYWD